MMKVPQVVEQYRMCQLLQNDSELVLQCVPRHVMPQVQVLSDHVPERLVVLAMEMMRVQSAHEELVAKMMVKEMV